jgi:hypothetical protein
MSRKKQIEDIRKVIANCDGVPDDVCRFKPCSLCKAERLYNAGYRKIPDNIGDFSDGYHTFNELYHHRAVLFSVICNMFPEKAWKSKLHDTGDMYEGMFIVGIETEQGQATYHYDIEPYWDMFKVKELDKAPKWDGHTPSDAIERIGNLSCEGYRKQNEAEWISVEERLPETEGWYLVYTAPDKKHRSINKAEFCKGFEWNNFEPYWRGAGGHWGNVTHWMPLPEPPKGE